MPLFSQENQGPEVIQAAFEVQWREGQAPVGQWNVKEGHWLDEIPWGVYEAPWPSAWETGQILTGSESWAEIPESSLTSRQRQLLNQELPAGQWTADAIADAAQWKGPLLRWNASKGCTSGCWTCPVPSGAGGQWIQPPAGPARGIGLQRTHCRRGPFSGCPFPIPECTASIEPG